MWYVKYVHLSWIIMVAFTQRFSDTQNFFGTSSRSFGRNKYLTKSIINYQLPSVYFRLLNDIFMILTHGLKNLMLSLKSWTVTTPASNLKQSSVSDKHINFLCTIIFKNQSESSRLLSRVYFKETDKHHKYH